MVNVQPHSEHRFPAPSSKLCQIYLRHWRGTPFISAQLFTDAVSALRKVWVLISLWKQPSALARTLTWDASTQGKIKRVRLDSNDFGFIWAGEATRSVMKQMSDIMWVVCNKVTTVWAPTKKLLISWQFSGPYGVTKYGSGWRKYVVNQCLEFGYW